ncbi:hypothetical protein [Tessaracoccus massiliensis]|uniref:hypothetical protein n=1 Tax=Tessaracoccus massiliensis TaxID=1522311 RepID=UPI00058E4BBC|nr:hypothetical protein [Tessaracoccus massiliensis]
MLEFASFSAWLPGAGVVLDDIELSCQPGEIWAVAGRTGAGASMLLRAAAGQLPRIAQISGRNRATRRVLFLGQLPPMNVAEYLRGFVDDVRGAADDLGLTSHLQHRIGTLPPDLRVPLHLAALRHAPAADLILLDAQLTAATPQTRREVALEARRRADDGAAVLWADHDLDTLWDAATHVVELERGRAVRRGPADEWQPLTLPPPTPLLLERLRPLPTGNRARPTAAPPAATSTVIDPADVGLTGRGLEVGANESLGLLDLSGRPEPLARRITDHLGGVVLGSHLAPEDTPLAATRRWCREAGAPQGAIDLTGLRPRRPFAEHSDGDAARLRARLSVPVTRPLWYPHPQAGLDARDRHALAHQLAGANAGPRIITTRDVEFLVRACRRITVVDDGQVIATGSPHAIARYLPELPLVAQATGSSRYLRLTDLPFEEGP